MKNNATSIAYSELLIKAIVAFSGAVGSTEISKAGSNNYNINNEKYSNAWSRSGGDYEDVWLHSDLKNVAYIHYCEFFGEIVIKGDDANCMDYVVNGRRDLLDFFPIMIDISDVIRLYGHNINLIFKHKDEAVNVLYTTLGNLNAGWYLERDLASCGPALTTPSHSSTVMGIDSQGAAISPYFTNFIKSTGGKGVFLMEGAVQSGEPLQVEAIYDNKVVASTELPLIIVPVEAMYHRANLKNAPATISSGYALPPDNGKNVIFLHGFKVNEQSARGWHSEMFKRLWQSGSNARFHGVTWEGNIGKADGTFNYHGNVVSAFESAPQLQSYVDSIPDAKVIMAHSLGNMVASTAIADHNMCADKFFMFNAAIPAEAFDVSLWNDDDNGLNPMMHNEWAGYCNYTWSACWHKLFSPNTEDSRATLKWKMRFETIVNKTELHNYYSGGDEILEVNNIAPSLLTGAGGLFNLFPTIERYSWHKQEVFKGRDFLIGTQWAGWGLLKDAPESSYDQTLLYPDASTANNTSLITLAVKPVFRWNPSAMFTNTITTTMHNEILAKGIPALSPATGTTHIEPQQWFSQPIQNVDMNNLERENGWPRQHAVYEERWLHSDLKDVAYFYTRELFVGIVIKGDL